MKDFKKGGFRPDFKKKSWDNNGGGFNKEDRQMHPATCAECGKSCQVPFRPSAGKQVFCNDCFSKMRGEETFERRDPFQKDRGFKTDSRSDFRKDFKSDRGGFNDRAPRFTPAPAAAPNMDGVIKQLQTMSMKLDTLMGMMTASKATPAPVAKEAKAPAPKAVEPKATKTAKAPKAEKPKKAVKKVSKKK